MIDWIYMEQERNKIYLRLLRLPVGGEYIKIYEQMWGDARHWPYKAGELREIKGVKRQWSLRGFIKTLKI